MNLCVESWYENRKHGDSDINDEGNTSLFVLYRTSKHQTSEEMYNFYKLAVGIALWLCSLI